VPGSPSIVGSVPISIDAIPAISAVTRLILTFLLNTLENVKEKHMELKSVYIDRTGDRVRSENNTGKFYLKEEVDTVIARLEGKLESVQAVLGYGEVVSLNVGSVTR
jgi:hypothetical protein